MWMICHGRAWPMCALTRRGERSGVAWQGKPGHVSCLLGNSRKEAAFQLIDEVERYENKP